MFQPDLSSLLPSYIAQQQCSKHRRGSWPAAALFADISGFTRLTETLLHQSKEGTEALSEALNQLFAPLVGAVYAQGGFIASFGGDSFTALFPLRQPQAALRAAQTALTMRQFFQHSGQIHTRFGSFDLQMRLGLAMGQVSWGIIDTEFHEGGSAIQPSQAYFFGGPAVAGSIQAQRHATQGQVVIDAQMAATLRESARLQALPGLPGYAALLDSISCPPPRLSRPAQVEVDLLRRFLPPEVLQFAASGQGGELRQAAPVFISIETQPRHRGGLPVQAEGLVETAIRLAGEFGGYFNKIDYNDQGGMMLVLFGAPLSHENDPQRAADFLLALTEQAAGLKARWRAGLAFGMVYAGMIGAQERSEYTAIGDVVNLAARLAQNAPWGQVHLSAPAAAHLGCGYLLEDLGEQGVKGKRQRQQIWRLCGLAPEADERLFRGRMVGRQEEMERLHQFIAPLFQGRAAGLLILYGEAGMGKSRLLHEFHQELRANLEAPCPKWLVGQADQTLRQSLNPFRYLLRAYFDLPPNLTEQEARRRFTTRLEALIRGTPNPALAQELERTRSFLGALVDLHWESSLYQQISPELRFRNTLYALLSLFQAESLRQPVILVLEDAHWLDDDSLQMLRLLVRNMVPYPLAVVCASRWDEDGRRLALGQEMGTPQVEIELRHLPPHNLADFARQVLGGPAAADVLAWLQERAGGNPFFCEQLLLDLCERGGLQSMETPEAGWRLSQEASEEVPESISAVLVARLDRLALEVRRVVQTAAVLGREFEVQVLARMLRDEQDVPERVQSAEAQAIWSALSEMRYIFKHALLRDAAYDMQLRAHLRNLHSLALEAIQQLHAADLSGYLADLAYHADRAGVTDQAVSWYRQAAERSAGQFANAEALRYFRRALELCPPAEDDPHAAAERYALLMGRERLYDLMGQRPAQEEDLAALEQVAALTGQAEWMVATALRRAQYAETIGEYEAALRAAQQALEGLEMAPDAALRSQARLQRGHTWLLQGDYNAARQEFESALEEAQAAGDQAGEADFLANLAVVDHELGMNLLHAVDYAQRALEIHTRLGNLLAQARALNMLGNIHRQLGRMEQALDYYQRSLAIKAQVGDKTGEAATLYNLAVYYHTEGNLAAALRCCDQSLVISRLVGSLRIQAYALTYLALLLEERLAAGVPGSSPADLHTAYEYYAQALAIRRQIHQLPLALDCMAGLGRASLGLGNLEEAQRWVQECLDWIARQGLDGIGDHFLVYRSAFEVFLACGQRDQALQALKTARDLLEESASQFSDPAERQAYLREAWPPEALAREYGI